MGVLAKSFHSVFDIGVGDKTIIFYDNAEIREVFQELNIGYREMNEEFVVVSYEHVNKLIQYDNELEEMIDSFIKKREIEKKANQIKKETKSKKNMVEGKSKCNKKIINFAFAKEFLENIKDKRRIYAILSISVDRRIVDELDNIAKMLGYKRSRLVELVLAEFISEFRKFYLDSDSD